MPLRLLKAQPKDKATLAALLCQLMSATLKQLEAHQGLNVQPLLDIGRNSLIAYCREQNIQESDFLKAKRYISALVDHNARNH